VQEPVFPLTERNGGQFHDRIGHGEFGRGRHLGGLVLADQAALWGLLQRITGLGLEVAGLRLVASESR
jgi:hypothetical protein